MTALIVALILAKLASTALLLYLAVRAIRDRDKALAELDHLRWLYEESSSGRQHRPPRDTG